MVLQVLLTEEPNKACRLEIFAHFLRFTVNLCFCFGFPLTYLPYKNKQDSNLCLYEPPQNAKELVNHWILMSCY